MPRVRLARTEAARLELGKPRGRRVVRGDVEDEAGFIREATRRAGGLAAVAAQRNLQATLRVVDPEVVQLTGHPTALYECRILHRRDPRAIGALRGEAGEGLAALRLDEEQAEGGRAGALQDRSATRPVKDNGRRWPGGRRGARAEPDGESELRRDRGSIRPARTETARRGGTHESAVVRRLRAKAARR